MKISHCKATGKSGKLKLECFNCGKTAEYDMPVSVEALDNFGKAFEKEHKNCIKKEPGRKLGKSKK
mgnify:CR=1 FL=1